MLYDKMIGRVAIMDGKPRGGAVVDFVVPSYDSASRCTEYHMTKRGRNNKLLMLSTLPIEYRLKIHQI